MTSNTWRNTARRLLDLLPFAAVTRLRTHRWLAREVRALRASMTGMPIERAVDVVLESPAFRPEQRPAEIKALLRLLENDRPRRILEIGGRRGGTLILFSHVAAPDAHLLSIDIEYDDVRGNALRVLARAGQRLEAWRADSQLISTRAAVEKWLGGTELDFLFIDGDHAYRSVARDFELYAPLVRKGGLVAFHDIVRDSLTVRGVASAAYSGGVPKFWDELKARHVVDEIVEAATQEGFGIGVLRTPDGDDQ
jgi:predicted O-methyltransferase YrrM